ncbi:hypothetical protein BIFBRE_05058 [Bifidobacterium breve DSM 20213 = JCM 1192]|uniref:Uncharacterized protein n=1 Tax=Bifidobacterium breve DSM 20213 = JCM 1192 TaxID=518634 RepID=D4BSG6_BIFBR|nr:hypothetical protein BIFBRE_05058 [Bifidobacterium breve DSM 20213 = JCM 1192]
MLPKDVSNGKGASHFFETHAPKPRFQCTFCKKDGHTVEFCFRRVKHERRVRAKDFKKPRSLLMARVILMWAPSRCWG